MKKKYVAIVIAAVVAIVVIVLVVTNPFGVANNSTEPNGNGIPNGNGPPTNGESPPGAYKPFGISSGKVIVPSCVFGEAEEHKITVSNNNNYVCNFTVAYRHPDFVADGYTRLSSDMHRWLWIEDKKPSLAPNEVKVIAIRLTVPAGAEIPGGKFEFWIGVIDRSQPGMVITELAQRWLVTMK